MSSVFGGTNSIRHKKKLQGRYESSKTAGETVHAFVSAPLSPQPPMNWTPELREKFDQALLALLPGNNNGGNALFLDQRGSHFAGFLDIFVCSKVHAVGDALIRHRNLYDIRLIAPGGKRA